MPILNALLASQELPVQQALAAILANHGFTAIVTTTVDEAEHVLSRTPVSLIFCSDELPSAGIDRLVLQTSHKDKVPLVVVSRLDDWSRFVHFLERGAFDYVVYPFERKEIERVLKAALGRSELLKMDTVPHEMPRMLKKGA